MVQVDTTLVCHVQEVLCIHLIQQNVDWDPAGSSLQHLTEQVHISEHIHHHCHHLLGRADHPSSFVLDARAVRWWRLHQCGNLSSLEAKGQGPAQVKLRHSLV
jgi:hypothetical protein